MPLLNNLKGIIYRADLLNSGSLLRVKGEPEHATILGGLISISLMIVLAAAFSNKILGTLDKQIISSTVTTSNAGDPTSLNLTTLDSGPFMLGVEVFGHDLNSNTRSFDVELRNTIYSYGVALNASQNHTLEPCTKQHWKGFPQLQNEFDILNIGYWMCLPKNTNFEIKGKYSSSQSKTIDILINKCTNNSLDTRPCDTQANIDKLFADNDGYLYFTVYFINPQINPESPQYIKYYLEDTNYLVLTQNGGEQSRLFVADYEIETDQSILPNSDYLIERGGIVMANALKSTYSVVTDTYASFYIYKSPVTIAYSRQFQKLDDVFSYVGGLFGTILILFFFISSYNTSKYEINLAGYLYRSEGQSQKAQKKYNFLYYLGQSIYSILRMFNFQPKWQKLIYYETAREEMVKQLDILFLLKRINFLQHALTFLFTQHQIQGIHLSGHFTMSEAIKLRRNYKLKAKLKNQIASRQHKDNTREYIDERIATSFQPNKDSAEKQKENIDFSFDSDRYSSESSSSDQEEGNVLESVRKLKAEQGNNPTSQRIYKCIDARLKGVIKSVAAKIWERSDERIMNFESFQTIKGQNQQNISIFVNPMADESEQESFQDKQRVKVLFSKLKIINSELQQNS